MDSKNKKTWRKFIFFLVTLLLIIAIIGIVGFYYTLFYENETRSPLNKNRRELINPAKGLSIEEAVEEFNEDFVYYLLVSLKAYKLKDAPFTNEAPKIIMYIDNEVFYCEIINGRIIIERDKFDEGDIIIRTSKEEAVKMILDIKHAPESFKLGLSEIELKAGRIKLASKGYLELYSELAI